MPIDRQSAEEIIALFRKADELCNVSLRTIMNNESLGHVKVYGRLVGTFMGNNYTNILAPLWKQFPELEPAEMKAPYVEPKPSLKEESQAAIAAFIEAANAAMENAKRLIPEAESEKLFSYGGLPEVQEKIADIGSFLDKPRFKD